MDFIILLILTIIIVLLSFLLKKQFEKNNITNDLEKLKSEILNSIDQLQKLFTLSNESLLKSQKEKLDDLYSINEKFRNNIEKKAEELRELLSDKLVLIKDENSKKLTEFRDVVDNKLENIRKEVSESLNGIRDENSKKLDDIKETVNEKLNSTLNKRISESFETVQNNLDKIHESVGEMRNLAGDVKGLKNVLSGVKARGTLGEYQLGAILKEILSPEQYLVNFETIPNSNNRVEFAIKLPAGEEYVYLPIDSKFPGDLYSNLLESYENGDKGEIKSHQQKLINEIKREAKEIQDKYIEVPYTTNFAILFLPFEGLYSEVINLGLLEELQAKYHVNIAGPSTMAALLNSLQMGFQTLSIQKRSNEVWEILNSVKSEFNKFEDILIKVQKNLTKTNTELDTLVGARTRSINKKLESVKSIEV